MIVKKSSGGYAQISNGALQDETLSFEARGVLAYLISKPDDWKVMPHDIQRSGNIGKHRYDRIMKELKESGYIKRWKYQNKKGRWVWDSIVTDDPNLIPDAVEIEPLGDFPPMDEPQYDFPPTGEPLTENHTIYKERYTNKDIQRKEERNSTPATIDDLNPKRNAGIHPPLSPLESFILGSIEAELNTHSLANWVFKVVNGEQVNLDTFKAFCESVDKDTFIADLKSILANWSNTGFARNNHPPTIGRILSVWNDDSAKASREFEALVVPLQEVIKRDKAEARRMVQTAAYEGIKATMKRNGINFDFVETARKEQWEKLK